MESSKKTWVWLGVGNVAADDPHSRPVYALIETARERSIEVRAAKLQLPANLNDPERIRQGAGNYNAMCVTCHLSPEAAATEMSKGLYPAPPNLSKQPVAAAEAFWVIKHGIKASGMPAWGGSMDDEFIWNMAAFLQELPKLDKNGYQALVESSNGHSHGGSETGGHSHGGDAIEDHHAGKTIATHVHADGKAHSHAAEPDKKPAEAMPPGEHDGHQDMSAKTAAQDDDDGHQH